MKRSLRRLRAIDRGAVAEAHRQEAAILDAYDADLRPCESLTRDEELSLADRMDLGDRDARRRFIESHLHYVRGIAARFVGRGVTMSDLIAAGNEALVWCVENRDHWRKEHRFINFAGWKIEEVICHELAMMAEPMEVPYWLYLARRRVFAATQSWQDKHGTLLEDAVLMREAKLQQASHLRAVREWSKEYVSLSTPTKRDEGGSDEDISVGDTLEDLRWMLAAETACGPIANARLRAAFEELLTPRQREILTLRFGLDDGESLNRAEVGRRLGIAKQAVETTEHRALAKLREAIEGPIAGVQEAAETETTHLAASERLASEA